ncbi:MAG: DUF885 family protein [Dethiosulfatibacter sp.]|nr:DUF885 family protein [Dethiosulfatibacter sp.]
MRNINLVYSYRMLDKECALFSDKIRNKRDYETTLLIPHINHLESLEKKLNALEQKANAIESPDDVFDLLKCHIKDFIIAQRVELKSIYERPSKTISMFMYAFSNAVRNDSRPDEQKVEILINRFSQADLIWEGIQTWITDVSITYLKELNDTCQVFIDTMNVEIPRIPSYFDQINEKQHMEFVEAIQVLALKMGQWIEYVKTIILERGISELIEASDDDVIKFEESYYKTLLEDVIGVNLNEILSWHEDEINKTRNEVFEIANKLNITDKLPETMDEVNQILIKYAGPCDTPEEMFKKADEYILRSRNGCKGYVLMPEDETCIVKNVPEQLKLSYPWGGYGGGCPIRRPLQGHMFLNNYNLKAVTDGWIKMNTVHEAYPGHHVQFVRTTLDPLPETVKIGAKSTPITEGTAHRSERVFEFVFPEDQFYPLFVAYRRHHTAVRIKADLMLRYFGNPIKDAVQLYVDELGFDRATARSQVKAQEGQQGYFTSYYYGMKKLCDWEKEYGYDEKEYTELLFAAGRISLENFEKFLKLNQEDKHSYLNDFPSLLQFN